MKKKYHLLLSALISTTFAHADGTPSLPSENRPAPRRDAHFAEPPAAQKTKTPAIADVRPALAVKNTLRKEINLPGVLKLDGEDALALDFTRARRIQMNNGGAIVVYISDAEPNRIQLPFVNPRVVSLNTIEVDRRSDSNNIYVSLRPEADKKKPIPIFIEHPSGRGPVLTLQLVPKGIISQTMIVDDVAPEPSESQLKEQRSSEYITQTQALLEMAAQGGVPQGYSQVALLVPPIAFNGVLIEVEKKLSNRDNDIFIYQVTNPGPRTAVLKENEFDGDLVQAVSIYPSPTLKAGEKTRVLVLSRKERREKK